MLKEIIAVCATAFCAFSIYLNGDGTTVTALFMLYGTLIGEQIAKKQNNKESVQGSEGADAR